MSIDQLEQKRENVTCSPGAMTSAERANLSIFLTLVSNFTTADSSNKSKCVSMVLESLTTFLADGIRCKPLKRKTHTHMQNIQNQHMNNHDRSHGMPLEN